MTVTADEIKFYYTISASASSGATTGVAVGTAGQGLGGYPTKVAIPPYILNSPNIFDDITGAEGAEPDVEYRCILISNAASSSNLTGVSVWLSVGDVDDTSDPDGATSTGNIEIARDYFGTTASAMLASTGFDPGSTTGQLITSITDEDTAPTATVTAFSDGHYSVATALDIGPINAGQAKAIWLKRTATGVADNEWDFDIEIVADSDDS